MMPDQVPLSDPGNALLAEQPAQLALAVVGTPKGSRLLLTIRTPTSTVTVFLNTADAKMWAALLNREASAMSAAGLIVAGGNPESGPS